VSPPARRPTTPASRRPRAVAPLVAVLERRGRFLTAEPLFPPREPADGLPRTRGPRRIVVAPARKGDSAPARAGDLVALELGARGGQARVLAVLGRPDVARDVIAALLLDRGLAGRFPTEVEREAGAAAERVARARGERRDLRELATFTIDPASARDFDDAISAEDLGGGRARLWVHIADVCAHVPEGSAVDREARRRATSVYVPGTVEPMLPHALSSEACSLLPGAERAAVTAELELAGGQVVRSSFYRSLIRSDERLDYERVDRIFAGAEAAAEPWGEPLRAARAIAAALQQQRERSGALVVDSAEPEFSFDERGDVVEILARSQTESHRLIEHLMIVANEAVAGLLAQRAVPCLYRVHERPEPERIERLADQLASLGVPTPPLPEPMSSTQAADLIGPISRRVEEHVLRTEHGRAGLNALVLRSLRQAYYSPRNIGHAGLHSPCYCHFTSPIRRYPDIVCHRALLSAVGGGERAPVAAELGELGAWTSEREREAMQIERDGDDIARCFALEQLLYELGQEEPFPGEITGLIPAGAFVAFGPRRSPATGAVATAEFEGMLPVRMLRAPASEPSAAHAGGRRGRTQRATRGRQRSEPDGGREWWELNEQGTILRGERSGAALRLGDELTVRVARVDTARGRVDLLPGG
jgi:ribonuclease R